jgi:hypothetical protein
VTRTRTRTRATTMITLTTPPAINSRLGSADTVAYDRMVLSSFLLDPVSRRVDGNLRITSTAAPDMQAVTGTLRINLVTGELVVEVDQLDFRRRIILTAGQVNTVQNIINAAQNSLESGLINLAIIAGAQSAGV